MLHKIIVSGNEIIEEILKDMGFRTEEKTSSIENSGLVRDIKTRINELGIIENKAHIEREALTHMCDYIIAAFKETKSPNVAPKAPEETKPPVEPSTEAPKEPEKPKTAEGTSSQKIDAEASDDLDLVIPRLRIVEDAVKAVVKILKDAPMTNRFQKVGDLCNGLITALKMNPEHNDIQRTARLEMAMGEALDFLQKSKLAARFGDLKEARKIVEEAMEKKSQV